MIMIIINNDNGNCDDNANYDNYDDNIYIDNDDNDDDNHNGNEMIIIMMMKIMTLKMTIMITLRGRAQYPTPGQLSF